VNLFELILIIQKGRGPSPVGGALFNRDVETGGAGCVADRSLERPRYGPYGLGADRRSGERLARAKPRTLGGGPGPDRAREVSLP